MNVNDIKENDILWNSHKNKIYKVFSKRVSFKSINLVFQYHLNNSRMLQEFRYPENEEINWLKKTNFNTRDFANKELINKIENQKPLKKSKYDFIANGIL